MSQHFFISSCQSMTYRVNTSTQRRVRCQTYVSIPHNTHDYIQFSHFLKLSQVSICQCRVKCTSTQQDLITKTPNSTSISIPNVPKYQIQIGNLSHNHSKFIQKKKKNHKKTKKKNAPT